MLKVNINVSQMKQGQPGARVRTADGQERLYDTVEFTKPPKLCTSSGSCWLETDAPVIGTRRAGIQNSNKVPFESIDWNTVKENPSHQVAMRVTPTQVFANDGSDDVIIEYINPPYRFFWGHGHLHIEKVDNDGQDITEMVEP